MSKLKFSIFLTFTIFTSQVFAIEAIIAREDLPFRTQLTPQNLEIKDIVKVPDNCDLLKLSELKNGKYLTSKYIRREQIFCKDDVKKVEKKSIIFNFGPIEIETDGKIIYENDEYVKIKKDNGKIEKIYKDGRSR